MFGNPESDKKDIAQQHHIDLKKGEGASEPSDSTWELASDLGSSFPTLPPPPPVQWM
jgi:hypothetical protein